jgi:hypothetical protein
VIREQQLVEVVDKVVEVVASTWCRDLRPPGAVGDADLGAENERCALIEQGAGEAEICHRVL